MENLVDLFERKFHGRRALVTGHTGFKGGWLSLWLRQLGAEIHGFSLPPPTNPNLHDLIADGTFTSETIADIRDPEAIAAALRATDPHIVFHMAAQPIVRESYRAPLDTLNTNITGTANLLDAIRTGGCRCAVVVVSSDKCYENRESSYAYREADPLGGHDVYSMSKAGTEMVASAWRRSFFQGDDSQVCITSARGGNVIGGGDFATERIVPDCMRALAAGKPIAIRNPHAVRPWQHVLDCLSGYLTIGAAIIDAPGNSPLASAFNIGPMANCQRPVRELVDEILSCWPGTWEDHQDPHAAHEAGHLSIAIEKAAVELGWAPVWDFPAGVKATVDWHRSVAVDDAAAAHQFSVRQIRQYCLDAASRNAVWTRSSDT